MKLFQRLSLFINVAPLLSSLLSISLFASTSETNPPILEKEKTKFELTSFIEIPTHSILISTDVGRVDLQEVSQRVQYNPTFGPTLGLRGAYNFWSFYLSKRLSFLNESEIHEYGKSSYDDWRFGYNITKEILIETYYQNYKGFYTDLSGQEGMQTSFGSASGTTGSTLRPATAKQIISRPDISALNYGLRATYVLPMSPLFRLFASDEERKFMTWEFNLLSKLYYNRLSVTGDQALVPSATANATSPMTSLKEYWANTLGIGLGLGVFFPVTETFSFGFDAMAGPGLQRQTDVFIDHESVIYTTAEELNANLYMDWNYKHHGFHTGLYVASHHAKVEDINFDSSNAGIQFAYTYKL